MTRQVRKTKYSLLERLTGHLKTVHMHRSLVRKHCFACGLYLQGLTHDLSKYSPGELIPSIRYYQGYRSPYPYEKELKGYSMGWLHHKGRNLHHWEYWYDTFPDKGWVPVKMPDKYLVESICDRIAACKSYTCFDRIDDLINIHVTGNDLVIRAYNTDHRLCYFFICHSKCMKQRPLRRCGYTGFNGVTIHNQDLLFH